MMFPFFILPLFLLLARRCRARLVNVTIDDKFGDERTGAVPTYIPEGQWTNAGQAGAYRSTLHQRINDLPANISIAFNGVRIYTFFAYWPASQVDLVFFLDGALTPTKRFTKPPYTGSDPLYWEFLMAFQSDTLDPGNHHLLVTSPGGPDTPLAFDYAIYTVDEPDPVDPDPPPPPTSHTTTGSSPSSTIKSTASSGNDPERTTTTPASITRDTNTGSSPSHTPSSPVAPIAGSSTPVGAIAGAVSGAVLALLLVFIAVCWRRRRRRRRMDEAFMNGPNPGQSGVTPFPARRANTASNLPAPVVSEKKSHRSGDSLAPFLAYSESDPPSSSSSSAGRKYDLGKGGSSRPSEPTTSDRAMSATASESRSEGTAFFRAELERVRAENARALREIEILRQVAEPPPYSHTGVVER